ncbi:O-antigen ligase family protein [Cohnella nanjingensis]|uniref:O-antigen ligase family protein n=1 Tax=Cohnella nanjingensis TaxID=1387779 RepID=A0A7X0VED5_9BACL|nr:O-antigen ligase family protein [Cohnella nanjingensis]MBB6670616.1 O-antigen ligase family protein [Cohnella nanjingensis]
MKKRNEAVSFMEWFAWAWIGVFLLIALFNNGTFEGNGIFQLSQMQFERPVLLTLLLMFFVAVWVAIHFLNKRFVLQHRTVYVAGAILLPFIYLVSSIQGVSRYLSGYGVLISLMLFILFAAGAYLIDYKRIIQFLPVVFMIFGYLIVLYGFLNLFGNVYLLDSLSAQDGVRTTSIFQYANAFAVLLLVMWVNAIIQISQTSRMAMKIVHGLMIVPILVSFLLTLSRGALLILPVIAIVALFMFRLKQQIKIILYSIVGMGLSLLIYTRLADRGIDVMGQITQALGEGKQPRTVSIFASGSLSSWGILIGVSIVMAGLAFLIERYVEPKLQAKLETAAPSKGLILPLALVVISVLGAISIATDLLTRFLPPVIRSRVEDVNFNTHSVYERLTMYKDALKIWKEYPIIGGGGGTWDALYESYQSYSYTSNQTHSFIVKYLIEVGAVGVALHVTMFAMVIVAFVRFYRKADEENRNRLVFYFITPVIILLHALIDFDMSYAFYGGIVFLCLGVMAGTQLQEIGLKWDKQKQNKIRYIGGAVLGIVGVVMLIVTSMKLYVFNQFDQATQETRRSEASFQVIESHLKQAHATDKKHPVMLAQLATWNYKAYEQTQDKQYLDKAVSYASQLQKAEPHYRTASEIEYVTQKALGNKEQALAIMEEAVNQRPFTQSYFEQVLMDLSSEWNAANQANHSTESDKLAKQIMDCYERMKKQDQVMKDLPDTVIPSKAFELSNTARLAAGKVQFAQRQYTKAAEILQTGVKTDLTAAQDQEVAAYYLASLRKEGKDDLDLYKALIQADATMEQKVDQLTSS